MQAHIRRNTYVLWAHIYGHTFMQTHTCKHITKHFNTSQGKTCMHKCMHMYTHVHKPTPKPTHTHPPTPTEREGGIYTQKKTLPTSPLTISLAAFRRQRSLLLFFEDVHIFSQNDGLKDSSVSIPNCESQNPTEETKCLCKHHTPQAHPRGRHYT